MRRILAILVLGVFAALAATMAFSADAQKSGKVNKSRFLVIAPHTAEQCLAALDEINAKGGKSLASWDFGCKASDHTAYQIVTAKSEEEARAIVPTSGREQARVVMLNKFTPADIKMFHEQMKATSQ